jgi:beta-1,4-N-acetylglucosaminyltransferase
MAIVYVTVGTTSFDALIEAVDRPEIYSILEGRGFHQVIFQIGRGLYEPKGGLLLTSFYRYSANYKDDIKKASLVLSHAGAGSIMDSLMEKKHLIVIPNSKLMDNHQEELAQALAERKHLFQTTCVNLPMLLASANFDSLVAYPTIDEEAFPNLVDAMMLGKQA